MDQAEILDGQADPFSRSEDTTRPVPKENEKLLPAVAIGGIVAANGIAQGPGDLPKDLVAGQMAEGVVDRLEVIKIDLQEPEAAACAGKATAGGPEILIELQAVAGTRQLIGASGDLQREVDPLEFGPLASLTALELSEGLDLREAAHLTPEHSTWPVKAAASDISSAKIRSRRSAAASQPSGATVAKKTMTETP